jgi:hypothetical protein
MAKKSNVPAGVKSAAAATQPEQRVPAKPEPKYYVYLGPTIAGMIQNGTIIQGTKANIREHPVYGAAIKRYPRIERLLVPNTTVSSDRLKVLAPGNALYELYRKLVSDTAR